MRVKRSASQIRSPGHGFSGEAMNHADEIEIARHGRELTAHGVPGQKKSAIAHAHENAIEASRDYNDFSANGNNPLNSVSQLRGAPHSGLSLSLLPRIDLTGTQPSHWKQVSAARYFRWRPAQIWDGRLPDSRSEPVGARPVRF
jgi:hypothetical protein